MTTDNRADQKVQGKDGNAPAEGTAAGDGYRAAAGSAAAKSGTVGPSEWTCECKCVRIIPNRSKPSVSKNAILLAKILKSVRIHLAARKSWGCQMDKR